MLNVGDLLLWRGGAYSGYVHIGIAAKDEYNTPGIIFESVNTDHGPGSTPMRPYCRVLGEYVSGLQAHPADEFYAGYHCKFTGHELYVMRLARPLYAHESERLTHVLHKWVGRRLLDGGFVATNESLVRLALQHIGVAYCVEDSVGGLVRQLITTRVYQKPVRLDKT